MNVLFTHSKIRLLVVLISLVTLISVSCGGTAAATPSYNFGYAEKEAAGGVSSGYAPMAPAPAREAAYDQATISNSLPVQQTIERIVIKNASLTLVVDDPNQSMEKISKLANELEGFVVSANAYQETLENGAKVPRASITIRIPSAKLDDVLAQIKIESNQEPLSENINSQDVTSEYTDLQSRLRNLEAAEAQLTKIMEQATKTEDVLNVYTQLVQVREQIEVIKGQIKYYEQSAALSSVSIELIANAAVQPLTIGGWKPVGVAKDAVQTLINTLKFIANAIIWIIIYVAPVLFILYIIFFLPASFLWRRWRKGRAAKKAAPPPPPAA